MIESNNSPCGQRRPGDQDLNTFDLIRTFRLDQQETLNFKDITIVQGSNPVQRAFRLQKQSNLTVTTFEAFPRGNFNILYLILILLNRS